MAFSTIKELVTQLFKKNPEVSKDEVIEAVIDNFPDSKFNGSHFHWYRHHLLSHNGRFFAEMENFNGDMRLNRVCSDLKIDLGKLIAATGIWAHPEVYDELKDSGGCWYPDVRRGKRGEKRGKTGNNGIRIDDNIYANYAIKMAAGIPPKNEIINFQAHHKTTDPRYHTNIANLVLLPKALASLSDNNKKISLILKFRAFELYHWYPEDEKRPVRPKDYPTKWKEPNPFGDKDKAEKYLKKRRMK